ncbi:MAG: polysaccharide deacetylase family protein [Christensenellales bacterium]|jgi:polysaccharide deacetylase family sporulation protein PdaB
MKQYIRQFWIPGLFALFVLALFLFANPSKPTVDKYENYVAADTLSGKRVLPVYGVNRSDNAIALTIDAAWGADKTPEILSILEERGVKATFFLVGRWVREFPEETKAIVEAGHLIGSHSDTHAHFCSLSNEQIEKEIKATEDALISAGAKKPTLFRPPFGEYDDRVVQKLRDLGYQVIQWSIDTLDWKEGRTAGQVLEVVLRKAAPGSIILCHNNAQSIVEYLPSLIDELSSRGYEFVTVDELIYTGFNIDNNGIQHPES